jgi:uncharacterized membrane protein HdeD (DUF308 family)
MGDNDRRAGPREPGLRWNLALLGLWLAVGLTIFILDPDRQNLGYFWIFYLLAIVCFVSAIVTRIVAGRRKRRSRDDDGGQPR